MNHDRYCPGFEFITGFYGSDFDSYRLKTQLELFSTMFDRESRHENFQIPDAPEFMRTRKLAQREQLSEVCKLFQLLVMPASSLRRIKSYLALP